MSTQIDPIPYEQEITYTEKSKIIQLLEKQNKILESIDRELERIRRDLERIRLRG